MLSYLDQEWEVSYQSKEQAQKGKDLLSTLQDVSANILDRRSLVDKYIKPTLSLQL